MKDKLSVVIPAASLVVILLCVAFQVFGDKEDDAVPTPKPAVTAEEQKPTPEPQPVEDTPTDEVVDIAPEVDPEPANDSVSALLDSGMSVEQIMEEKFGYVEDPNQPEPTVVEMEYPEGAVRIHHTEYRSLTTLSRSSMMPRGLLKITYRTSRMRTAISTRPLNGLRRARTRLGCSI